MGVGLRNRHSRGRSVSIELLAWNVTSRSIPILSTKPIPLSVSRKSRTRHSPSNRNSIPRHSDDHQHLKPSLRPRDHMHQHTAEPVLVRTILVRGTAKRGRLSLTGNVAQLSQQANGFAWEQSSIVIGRMRHTRCQGGRHG